MPVVTLETLKGYFNDGDVPNESHYIDLIDTLASMGGGGGGPGTGDMLKAIYDTDADGVVDGAETAVDADMVDGLHASAFHRTTLAIVNANSARIGGGLTVGNILTAPGDDNIYFDGGLRSVKSLVEYQVYGFVPLITFLTDTHGTPIFNGQAHSTTAKTAMQMNARYGVPNVAKAFALSVRARDSASATLTPHIIIGPNNIADAGCHIRLDGVRNDNWVSQNLIVPCSALGELFYQISATGAGTLDLHIQVYGYYI